jgi:hypothetical protein
MTKDHKIDARWADEAQVWIAISAEAPGLVLEASSWAQTIEEARLALPDLLELEECVTRQISLTFKAETHLNLAAE